MKLMKMTGTMTMSSLEIAELTGKRHDNVLTDVRKLLEELSLHAPDFSGTQNLLTPIQKQAMLSLQKANTVYLEEGLSFDERKERLNTLFNRRWNDKLIEECHLLCE